MDSMSPDKIFSETIPALKSVYDGNSANSLILAAGVFAGIFVVLFFLKKILFRRLKTLRSRGDTAWKEGLCLVVSKTKVIFIFLIALYFSISTLDISDKTQTYLNIFSIIILLLQLSIWGNEFINFYLRHYRESHLQKDAASVTTIASLGFLAKLVLFTVVILLAFNNLGVNLTALLTGLGIGGIAVALAAQNILGDLFASLSIVFDRPFVIGDFIVVENYQGTVENIGMKTTRIRSISGEQIIFSNADLLKSRIRNYKRMQERRVLVTVLLQHTTLPGKVANLMPAIHQILESQKDVRVDRVHFKTITDKGLLIEIAFFVRSSSYNTALNVQDTLNLKILEYLNQEEILLAKA